MLLCTQSASWTTDDPDLANVTVNMNHWTVNVCKHRLCWPSHDNLRWGIIVWCNAKTPSFSGGLGISGFCLSCDLSESPKNISGYDLFSRQLQSWEKNMASETAFRWILKVTAVHKTLLSPETYTWLCWKPNTYPIFTDTNSSYLPYNQWRTNPLRDQPCDYSELITGWVKGGDLVVWSTPPVDDLFCLSCKFQFFHHELCSNWVIHQFSPI